MKTIIPYMLHKVPQYGKRGFWMLYYIVRGLVGTMILILAVAATAACYLIALPWILFKGLRINK